MKYVFVTRDLCQGHGVCAALAPDVFPADSDGYNTLSERGHVALRPADEQAALNAAQGCPERAISLTDR